MTLSIRSQIRAPELNRRRLRSLTRRLLRAERRPDTLEISLLLCDDATIRALNREYRGKDRPTDVLSFPQEEGPAMPLGWAEEEIPHVLGDVVLSVETARRQAEEHGGALQEEAEALLAHGIFHLLGYDHETPEKRAAMRARENELLGEKSVWMRGRAGEEVEADHADAGNDLGEPREEEAR
ncbi:MAG: rRNA maturation RNase YbeY [Armatimonadetes bacterium]|nr:rRNA maturation RNase YbeY [Armatimonadota bacterium]